MRLRKRYYEVVRDLPLRSKIPGSVPEWGVIKVSDRTFIVQYYWNLWDAGAKMQKLNAREDQPA